MRPMVSGILYGIAGIAPPELSLAALIALVMV